MPELGASSRTLNWDEFDNEQGEGDMKESKRGRPQRAGGWNKSVSRSAAPQAASGAPLNRTRRTRPPGLVATEAAGGVVIELT
jgi:hypothetical protein